MRMADKGPKLKSLLRAPYHVGRSRKNPNFPPSNQSSGPQSGGALQMDPALIFGARSGSIKQDPSLTMKEAFAMCLID